MLNFWRTESLLELGGCLGHGHRSDYSTPTNSCHLRPQNLSLSKVYCVIMLLRKYSVEIPSPPHLHCCANILLRSITATIFRVIYLNKYPASDVADLWMAVICTQIEIGISISSTCVPYMRPFFSGLEVCCPPSSCLWAATDVFNSLESGGAMSSGVVASQLKISMEMASWRAGRQELQGISRI